MKSAVLTVETDYHHLFKDERGLPHPLNKLFEEKFLYFEYDQLVAKAEEIVNELSITAEQVCNKFVILCWEIQVLDVSGLK